MQVLGILMPKFHHGALYSQNRHDRYFMFAALNLGMTQPLLATALAVRKDPVAETRLRTAFPHQRKLVDRLARLARSMPNRGTEGSENWNCRFQEKATVEPTKARIEYLAAARQAIMIIQLGETADRSELLRCAENILEATRQQPVDIQ